MSYARVLPLRFGSLPSSTEALSRASRALASSHTGVADALWGSVLAAYEAGTAAGERRAVMARLEAVRKRGRKRMMEAFG